MQCPSCPSGRLAKSNKGSLPVCNECGTVGSADDHLQQDLDRAAWRAEQHHVPQIAKDYISYGIPNQIANAAVTIYTDVVGKDTLKRDTRKAMMCKCAYDAYAKCGVPKDPILLAKKFGIELAKLREAQTDFYERLYNIDPENGILKHPKPVIDSKDLLREFLLLFGIESAPYEDLYIVIDKIYGVLLLKGRIKCRDISVCVAYWYATRMMSSPNDDHISVTEMCDMTEVAKSTAVKILSIIENL